ncbi:MAG TPA: hypothetical protein VIQ54_09425 [Polyangia bacterium]|jgi:hypothetical protein
MDDLRPRGLGRFVLRALAIASALGFLTLLMVQAMAFYAEPPKPKKPSGLHGLRGPATKAAPVVRPRPLVPLEDLWPGTKAGPVDQPVPLWQPAPAARP